MINARWNKPGGRWFKLNLDGSSLGNPGRASVGSLIRDSNELWVKGFTHDIGISSNVDAKLWALRDGLPLCISLKFWLWRLKLMLKLFLIGFLVSTIAIYIILFLVWIIGSSLVKFLK